MSKSQTAPCAAVILLAACVLHGAAAAADARGCPQDERGSRLADAAHTSGEVPYLFRKQQAQICPDGGQHSCANPIPYRWQQFCTFEPSVGGGWAEYMVCDEARQRSIVQYYRERGVEGFGSLLAFSPCELWPLIRGRTLWIVGDSHSYDLFHAITCFLIQLWDYDFEGGFPYAGELEAFGHLERHVEHYKPPECIPLLEETLICQVRVNKGEMLVDHVLPMLQQRMARPTDIAVVNVAHWHNGWEGHEYRDLLRSFRDAVAEHASELPHFVWKEMVATHYQNLHGAYKGGTPPFECAPLGVWLQPDGSLATDEDNLLINTIVLEGGAHNKVAREVFAGTDIAMTGSWNATVELWEYHRDLADGRGHECGHSCFPAAPEVYLYYVFLAIRGAPWRDRL